MDQGKLKTAVLGLGPKGQFLLKAASKIDLFQIDAVADKDTTLAEQIAVEYKCTPYDDFRQLVMQNDFDCLLIAAGLFSCMEFVRTAVKKKCNILKMSPAGTSFEQTMELVRLAEHEKVLFSVAEPNRFAQSFIDSTQKLKADQQAEPFLINAVNFVADNDRPPWHNDLELAGGKVLLRDSYFLIDLIVKNFGIPQQVYAHLSSSGDRKKRQYSTEETAVVMMRFSPSLVCDFRASCQPGIGQPTQSLTIHCHDKIYDISHTKLAIQDIHGQTIEDNEYNHDLAVCTAKLLNNFAMSILDPDQHTLETSGRSNLDTMAVIESAYLSARTATPESPLKLMQILETKPDNIWPQP